MMLCAKFGSNWLSGKEYENIKVYDNDANDDTDDASDRQ